ncbi:hypothetical protein MS5935_40090 [Klebsiella pneumoniae]|nr:hypothetical protein MS5935_40090 [Klebsiella pneumoniae]
MDIGEQSREAYFHSLPNDYYSAGFITCSCLLHGETESDARLFLILPEYLPNT